MLIDFGFSAQKMHVIVQKMDKTTEFVNGSGESVENLAILIWVLHCVRQCLSSLVA